MQHAVNVQKTDRSSQYPQKKSMCIESKFLLLESNKWLNVSQYCLNRAYTEGISDTEKDYWLKKYELYLKKAKKKTKKARKLI